MNITKLKLSEVKAQGVGPIDLFICSASFESRCRAFAGSLDPRKVKAALVLEAVDLRDYTEKPAKALASLFPKKASIARVSTNDPLLSADNISRQLAAVFRRRKPERVLLDISTFTHELLLILIQLLRMRLQFQRPKLTIAYVGAKEYSIGDPLKSKWLSKGVRGVRTVLGFPGDSLPSRKTHLIIVVGYEVERALKLIQIIQPNTISLGFARSSSATTEKNKNANEHYHRLLKRLAGSYAAGVESFEIFCNDPAQTRDAILRVAGTKPASNVLLAPMNNKMSTVGAALAAFQRPDIQMCYAPVLAYNFRRYSKPSAQCYLVEIPELLERVKKSAE